MNNFDTGTLPPESQRELDQYDQTRRSLREDPYYPAYHFTSPGGIVHDPNGACYWNGRYHLFYQFFPPDLDESTPWDEAMHWGHAVSEDLVHWRDLPIALAPDPGPELSCYSGQALVEDDRVVLAYYGPDAGICFATGDDEWLVDVEKSADNPVIPDEAENDPYTVFDPDIWTAEGTYYALSGAQKGDRFTTGEPAAYLFRSTDLVDWEYLGPFVEDGSYTVPGEDAAVPNFFELGDEHVLLCFSHHRGPHYFVGEYDEGNHRFTPRTHGRLTHGPTTHDEGIGGLELGTLHAPSVLDAPDGRKIAFFNVTDGAPQEGWSQLVSLPRVLGLDDAGRLTVGPPSELERLRGDHRSVAGRSITADSEVVVEADAGRTVEVSATIAPGDASQVGLSVLRSDDGTEHTDVSYYERADGLELDTTESTTRSDVPSRPPEQAPLELGAEEPLELRVFVDRSVVEVFANGRQSLTARVYPDTDSTGISLFARRTDAELLSMDVWEMASTWNV